MTFNALKRMPTAEARGVKLQTLHLSVVTGEVYDIVSISDFRYMDVGSSLNL